MRGFIDNLRQRKVAQWGMAYLAAAWVAVEVVNALGEIFAVPIALQRGIVLALGFGFLIALVIAWYHGEEGRQRTSGRELVVVATVLLLAGASLGLIRIRSVGSTSTVAPTDAESVPADADPDPNAIAVLPFADLSPDGDQEYFGDGIAEELLGALSQLDGVRVASRTSAFSFKGQSLDVREIGRRLGVGAVIEGSVRKSGERLRVDARLISVEEGFRLWSERFDANARDIFAVQDSIARAVASALRLRLSDARELTLRGQTRDHEAQDLYLQGRFAWNQRTRDGLEAALELFQAAVARDPAYARALVGLGDAYAVLGFYDYRPPTEAFPRAKEAARRAVALDSTLAEPHATLGYAALYYDWAWEAAEAEFRRALELDPGYPTAHQWYANYLTAMGRFEEAEASMRTASELDPLSTIAFAAIGWVQLYARSFEEAARHLDATIARSPQFELAYVWNGQANEALGRLDEAERLLRHAVDLSGGSAISRAALARVLWARGSEAAAREVLDALINEEDGAYVPSYEIARAFAGGGDLDGAVTWLRRALEDRAHSMAFLAVDPLLDDLHGHPGYRELRLELGLPDG